MPRKKTKKTVVAFTPSPALDLSGTVDGLKPNEKSYVYDEVRSPGGNAINAARILSRLKVDVLATGFLGGSTGEEIEFLLQQEGVKCRFVKIKGHSRICVTVANNSDHKQTRLTFPAPPISAREKNKLFQFVQKQKQHFLIIGGSLPQGVQPSDIVRLMKMAQNKNIKCVVDSPAQVLRKLIAGNPFFIKPNLTEFQLLTNTRATTINGVKHAAKDLLKKIPFICVSSVEGGALLLTHTANYFGRIPHIKIKSTVGAGDSMVGAMVAQFCQDNPSESDILRWGLAAAAATLEEKGTAFGSAKRIHQLYQQTKVITLT